MYPPSQLQYDLKKYTSKSNLENTLTCRLDVRKWTLKLNNSQLVIATEP